MRLSVKLCILIKCGFDNNLPSRQHLRRVKQNKVAPPRKGSKLYAATPRSNSISRRRSSGFTTWNARWLHEGSLNVKLRRTCKTTQIVES